MEWYKGFVATADMTAGMSDCRWDVTMISSQNLRVGLNGFAVQPNP